MHVVRQQGDELRSPGEGKYPAFGLGTMLSLTANQSSGEIYDRSLLHGKSWHSNF
jgi:hypothetical protein